MCEQMPNNLSMFIVDSEEESDQIENDIFSEAEIEISSSGKINIQGNYLNSRMSEN